MSKITVIVPVYNVGKYLRKCLDSITDQTYKDLEIILVDDGSTDDSGNICDEYAKNDNRIKVIHKENSGVASARNTGIEAMTGELVVFIDADDYVSKEYIYTMYGYMDDDIDMVVSRSIFVKEDEEIEPDKTKTGADKIPFNESFNVSAYYRHYTIWGTLIRRELIGDNRFESGLYVGEDTLYYYTLLKKCRNIAFMHERMYYYVQYTNSAIHGVFDEKKYTEICSWEKVVDLFADMKNVQKFCYAEYIERCLRVYKRIFAAKANNKEYMLDLRKRVRKSARYIRYMRNSYLKWHASLLCISMNLYNLYLKEKT